MAIYKKRKATTILAADIVGYSKLIGNDESGTLNHYREVMRQIVRPTIVRFHGRIFKFLGDAFLAEFVTQDSAVQCAIQIQSSLVMHNTRIPEGKKLAFRMGIHWGEVTEDGDDLLGDTVNIASRLESLAAPGGIVTSDIVKSSISASDRFGFTSEGEQELKNISVPVVCHSVLFDPAIFSVEEQRGGRQPYRGLLAFREEDSKLFFGREAFVDQLESAVTREPLVAVIGSSGSGKSSVVSAGLLPRLREKGYLIAQFRPGSQPFMELATALQPLMLPDLSVIARRTAAKSLAETFGRGEIVFPDISAALKKRHPDAVGIALIADQFEEFLTLCNDRLQRELFQDLIISGFGATSSDALSGDELLPLVVVTTCRADFMGRMLEYRPLADAMQNGDIKLGPMNREELRRTIENPARSEGVGFAPGLVERILDDVGDEPGNLPLLQFALTALWDKDAELGAELSHQAYELIGRVHGALAYHADDVLNSLQPSEQLLAREIFVQLVQPGEGVSSTRRVATRQELGESAWRLVQRLADSRLVITGRNTRGDETVEVVHEALIRDWGVLVGWLKEDFEFRSWQERLRSQINQWIASDKDSDGLLRGRALSQAVDWLETHEHRIVDIEADFIRRGQELLQEQNEFIKQQLQQEAELSISKKNVKRFKSFALALAGVLALAIVAAGAAISQRQSAITAKRVADGERIIAQTAQQNAEEARKEAEQVREAVEVAKAEVELLNRQILSQQLAAEAVLTNNNASDRAAGLPLLLSTESVKSTLTEDGFSMLVANNALRQAVRTAPSQVWRKLQGHTGRIETGHFSSNGRLFVTGGNDKLIRIWDVDSGVAVHTLEGHQQRVTQARFIRENSAVVSSSMDGTVRLWNVTTGELLQTFSDHDGAVYEVAISDDRQTWASISYDATARIVDAASGDTLTILKGQGVPLYIGGFSPDGSQIVTAGDLAATLWDVETGESIATMDTGITAIRSIDFNHSGDLFVIRGEDNHVDVRSSLDGQRVYDLIAHGEAAVWSARFSPDGKHLLTAGGDGTIRSWLAESGAPVRTFVGHERAASGAVFSPDGKLMASAAANGSAIVWDTQNAKAIAVLEGHTAAVSNVVFSPDGKLVATTGNDGVAGLWKVADFNSDSYKNRFELKGLGGGGQAVAFHPTQPIVATGSYNGIVILWDTNTGEQLFSVFPADASSYAIDFSPDGRLLASVGNSELTIWNMDDNQLIVARKLDGMDEPMLWVEFSPDGELVLATSMSGNAAIVQSRTGAVVHSLKGHQGALFWSGFSPDGQLIATASYADNTVRIWDVTSGKTIHVLKAHSGGVYRCDFSTDSQFLVTASNDTTAKIWSTKSGALIQELEGHGSTVRAAAFSPDGSRVVTGSYDATAKVWNAATGELLHTLTGHQSNLMTVHFFPDGKRVMTTSYDATAKIWDLESGLEIHSLIGHTDKLEAADISDDGRLIVTQGHDEMPRIWIANVKDLLLSAEMILPRDNGVFSTEELKRFRLGSLLARREQANKLIEESTAFDLQTDLETAKGLLRSAYEIDDTALAANGSDLALRVHIDELKRQLALYERNGMNDTAKSAKLRLDRFESLMMTDVQ